MSALLKDGFEQGDIHALPKCDPILCLAPPKFTYFEETKNREFEGIHWPHLRIPLLVTPGKTRNKVFALEVPKDH